MKLLSFLVFLSIALSSAADVTGPAEWKSVHTNAIQSWCSSHQKKASARYRVFHGVVADLEKKEVRLLAEAVGHRIGLTTEFLLVGPLSDRGYEAFGVTVAQPSDIVRAVEALGVPRGGGVSSIPFRFWSYGEHFSLSFSYPDHPEKGDRPISDLIVDSVPAQPLLKQGEIVFTGGAWEKDVCQTDTNMPSSVISLYNEFSTVFDLTARVGQSEVYGRLSTAASLPKGTLLEFVLRPLYPPDGKPRMLPLHLTLQKNGDEILCRTETSKGKLLKTLPVKETLLWLRSQAEAGREPFVTLAMDEQMTLAEAIDHARIFSLLDGKGLKLDGKPKGGVYPLAFLPQQKWRDRKERVPQPFELHVFRSQEGKVQRKLTFIEEDWNVPGLDPKLTPKDYPFESWSEFAPLVQKVGGPENKVNLLFVYGPTDLPLKEFLPGVQAVARKLPLVYFFPEQ